MIDTSVVSAGEGTCSRVRKKSFFFCIFGNCLVCCVISRRPVGCFFTIFPLFTNETFSSASFCLEPRSAHAHAGWRGRGGTNSRISRPEIRSPPPSCRVRLPRNEDFLREKMEFAPKRVARNNGSRENYELVAG